MDATLVGTGVRGPRGRWYCLSRHAVERYPERCPAALTPLTEAVRFSRFLAQGRRRDGRPVVALVYPPEMVIFLAVKDRQTCWVVLTVLSSLYNPRQFGPLDPSARKAYRDFRKAGLLREEATHGR